MSTKTVSIIGTGNVAWHIAPALDNSGYSIFEVYGRNQKNVKLLTSRLYQAVENKTLDFSGSKSSIFIIAVSDDAIEEVAQEIVLPDDALLIHTSASRSLKTLDFAATTKTGIFFPLQSFTKTGRIDFNDVPIFIETDDDEVFTILNTMGKSISKEVQRVSADQRKALHIASVFAASFTNHMMTLAKDIASKHHIDFSLLKPLVSNTLSKSLELGPGQAHAGPAEKQDFMVLDQHLEFLTEDSSIAEIYRVITQHIIDRRAETT